MVNIHVKMNINQSYNLQLIIPSKLCLNNVRKKLMVKEKIVIKFVKILIQLK